VKTKNTATGGHRGLPSVGTESIKNLAGKELLLSPQAHSNFRIILYWKRNLISGSLFDWKMLATGEASMSWRRNARRGSHESPAAARRSRPSKRRFAQGIPNSKGSAGRWPIGQENCGCCNDAEDWLTLRPSWLTFARAAGAWRTRPSLLSLGRERKQSGTEAEKPAAAGAGRAEGRGSDATR
jgi:hypothetical protein